MSLTEGPSRRASFNRREELNNKIDKLMVMIGKVVTKDSRRTRLFKPQIHQNRGRSQNRGYNKRKIRIRIGQAIDQTVGIEDSRGRKR